MKNTISDMDDLHHRMILLGEGLQSVGIASSSVDEFGHGVLAGLGHAVESLGSHALALANELEAIKDRVTTEAAQ